MPATKFRTRVTAAGFQSSSPQYRDLYYPWQDFFVAASVRAFSASYQVYALSGSLPVMLFPSDKNTCAVWVSKPTPLDIALDGAAAGSGTVYVDWGNASNADAGLTITASLVWLPPASAIGDVGTCTLGTACATVTGTSVSEINTASLFQFATPASRNGQFSLRAIVNTADAATSSSPFILGYRVRYNADRLGS